MSVDLKDNNDNNENSSFIKYFRLFVFSSPISNFRSYSNGLKKIFEELEKT